MNELLDTDIDKFLIIKIGTENYAIPVSSVLEILTPHNTTKIPNVPKHVRGIMNLRGRILPVVDVKKSFDSPMSTKDLQECFVVVEFQEYVISIVCHEVLDVKEITGDEIQKENNEAQNYISGIYTNDEGSFIFLDLEKLLPPISKIIND